MTTNPNDMVIDDEAITWWSDADEGNSSADTTDRHSLLAFDTWLAQRYGVTRDDMSCDAENVMRRDFRNGVTVDYDTFTGSDGRLYIRFA